LYSTAVVAGGSVLGALGALFPRFIIGLAGLSKRGGTKFTRSGIIVLVASVNIGIPKLWVLPAVAGVKVSGRVTGVLPGRVVVSMLPAGLPATKFP
jgi:hypothetical protein